LRDLPNAKCQTPRPRAGQSRSSVSERNGLASVSSRIVGRFPLTSQHGKTL
jgi:hypothetical protein